MIGRERNLHYLYRTFVSRDSLHKVAIVVLNLTPSVVGTQPCAPCDKKGLMRFDVYSFPSVHHVDRWKKKQNHV